MMQMMRRVSLFWREERALMGLWLNFTCHHRHERLMRHDYKFTHKSAWWRRLLGTCANSQKKNKGNGEEEDWMILSIIIAVRRTLLLFIIIYISETKMRKTESMMTSQLITQFQFIISKSIKKESKMLLGWKVAKKVEHHPIIIKVERKIDRLLLRIWQDSWRSIRKEAQGLIRM